MPIESYNPDQAAPMIGASASTIRNWCKVYAVVLSEGANPSAGTERRLTLQDIARLQRVKIERDNRTPPQEIISLLQAAASNSEAAHITVDATPQAPQKSQEGRSGDSLFPMALSSIEKRQDSTDARLASIERKLEAQAAETRSRQDLAITMLVLGVLLGWVIIMVLQLAITNLNG